MLKLFRPMHEKCRQRNISDRRRVFNLGGASGLGLSPADEDQLITWSTHPSTANEVTDAVSPLVLSSPATYGDCFCLLMTGAESVEIVGLTASNAITLGSGSTATPTAGTDTITFTAGIVSGIYIDGVLHYWCADGEGSTLRSLNKTTWPDATLRDALLDPTDSVRSTAEVTPWNLGAFTPYSRFDGVGDSVNIGSQPIDLDGQSFSICMRCSINNSSLTFRTIQNRGTGSPKTGFQISANPSNNDWGNTFIEVPGVGSVDFAAAPLNENDGDAHRISLTFDTSTGTANLYLDNVKYTETDAALIGANLNALDWIIGSSNQLSQYLDGEIHRSVVFDRLISDAEELNCLYEHNPTITLVPSISQQGAMVDSVTGTIYENEAGTDLGVGLIPADPNNAGYDVTGGELQYDSENIGAFEGYMIHSDVLMQREPFYVDGAFVPLYYADMLAAVPFADEQVLRWKKSAAGNCQPIDWIVYPATYTWSPEAYIKTNKWYGEYATDCGAPALVPLEVTSGGIGPDGTWREGVDGEILFALPE